MVLSNKEKKILLKLARQSIAQNFDTNIRPETSQFESTQKFNENRGTFVTLTISDELRGCIGHIHPIQPLYKDIIENAQAAAFEDPRFQKLTEEELPLTKIEISILDLPQKLIYQNAKDLINKLQKNKPGVILKSPYGSATFLPQVWDQLPKTKEFLEHLAMKAGLTADDWQKKDIEIETYKVNKLKEI